MNKTEKEVSQGKFFNEPIDEYHRSGAFGSTHLRAFIESENKFLHLLKNPLSKNGDALDLGSALHCLVLENQYFKSRYAIGPEVDRRTKDGRDIWDKFCESNEQKMILKKDQYDMANDMHCNIMNHDLSVDLLKDCSMEQCCRVKLNNGLRIQCRPDAHKKNHIIDIKTCQDVKDFKWDIKKYGYDIQAAFYYFIMKSIDPENYENADFYFISVDKTEVKEVKVFGIDNDTLNDLVNRKIKLALVDLGIFMEEIGDINNYKYQQKEIEWLNI